MFLHECEHRSRLSARLPALVLVLVLGWLARPEKALAQYDYSGVTMNAWGVMAAVVSVPVLVTDLAIITKLAHGRPVSLGWSVTGLSTSFALSLIGGGGLAIALKDPSAYPSFPPILGASLALGGVSIAIASAGLHFRPRRDSRRLTNPTSPPESKIEVELRGQWEENAVLLRGAVIPHRPTVGRLVRLRIEFDGQAEEWMDVPLDAQGHFHVELAAPAERQRFKAVAWFKERLRLNPAASNQVQLSRPGLTTTAPE